MPTHSTPPPLPLKLDPVAARPAPRPDGRKLILVVEDDPTSCSMLAYLLKTQGFEVLTAANGAEAMSRAQHLPPDLILLDLGLEDASMFGAGNFDGFSVMEWLRRRHPDQPIPIIVLTAREGEAVRRKALAAGAAAFFNKPYDAAKLLEAVRAVLGAVPGEHGRD